MLAALIRSWLLCIEEVCKNLDICFATQEKMYCIAAVDAVYNYFHHWTIQVVDFIGPELYAMISVLWTVALIIIII